MRREDRISLAVSIHLFEGREQRRYADDLELARLVLDECMRRGGGWQIQSTRAGWAVWLGTGLNSNAAERCSLAEAICIVALLVFAPEYAAGL